MKKIPDYEHNHLLYSATACTQPEEVHIYFLKLLKQSNSSYCNKHYEVRIFPFGKKRQDWIATTETLPLEYDPHPLPQPNCYTFSSVQGNQTKPYPTTLQQTNLSKMQASILHHFKTVPLVWSSANKGELPKDEGWKFSTTRPQSSLLGNTSIKDSNKLLSTVSDRKVFFCLFLILFLIPNSSGIKSVSRKWISDTVLS